MIDNNIPPMTLEDLKVGNRYINRKTGNIYTHTGYTFHSENLDYMVKYTDYNDTEWSRPIGLFLLKFVPLD